MSCVLMCLTFPILEVGEKLLHLWQAAHVDELTLKDNMAGKALDISLGGQIWNFDSNMAETKDMIDSQI